MARVAVIVLLTCFLVGSRANPVISGNEESVKTQDAVVPAAEKQNQDVKEKLEVADTISEEEPIKDEIKTVITKDEVKSDVETEVPSREGRNLGGGNQVNEIGGGHHEMISETEDALLRKLNNKCSERDVSSCVMLKLVTYMNRLLKKSNIELFEGLHITQTVSEEEISEDAEPLENPRSSGDEDEETQLSQLMANKLWTFVRTRSLRWSVLPDADVVLGTSPDQDGALNVGMSFHTGKAIEKGRRKGGNNNNMRNVMGAVAMKIALLGGLAFKGLVLLVGKALLVSKIALLLASILWLKKLFSHQKHVTYEVVSHPHHSHSTLDHHGGGGGGDSFSSGWGRSSEAHQLAYSGYAPSSANH